MTDEKEPLAEVTFRRVLDAKERAEVADWLQRQAQTFFVSGKSYADLTVISYKVGGLTHREMINENDTRPTADGRIEHFVGGKWVDSKEVFLRMRENKKETS